MNETRLSDHRGTGAGIRFFQIFLSVFGIRHACIMAHIVAAFYAVFDRTARRKTAPYLRHRFPADQKSVLKMLIHTVRLFGKQAEYLVLQEAVRRNRIPVDNVLQPPEARERILKPGPLVLLISHAGPWQALMSGISCNRPVSVLVQPDANVRVDKFASMKSGKNETDVRVISTESAFGGLVEASQALEQGNIVAVMADRCYETEPVYVSFLGEKAAFPAAGFYLASRFHCPAMCLFTVHHNKNQAFAWNCRRVIQPELTGRARNGLAPYVQQYAACLESYFQEHPYDCFLFHDLWKQPIESERNKS